jgi:hypothetical protein
MMQAETASQDDTDNALILNTVTTELSDRPEIVIADESRSENVRVAPHFLDAFKQRRRSVHHRRHNTVSRFFDRVIEDQRRRISFRRTELARKLFPRIPFTSIDAALICHPALQVITLQNRGARRETIVRQIVVRQYADSRAADNRNSIADNRPDALVETIVVMTSGTESENNARIAVFSVSDSLFSHGHAVGK